MTAHKHAALMLQYAQDAMETAEPVAWKKRLVEIHDALSYELGDTDPHIEDDMTDEEVREEMPVFWAAKEVAALIAGIDAALTQPSTTFSTSTTSTAVLK